jgi:hypothetical protein
MSAICECASLSTGNVAVVGGVLVATWATWAIWRLTMKKSLIPGM